MFNRTFISGSSLESPGIYNQLALVLLIASQGLDTYSNIHSSLLSQWSAIILKDPKDHNANKILPNKSKSINILNQDSATLFRDQQSLKFSPQEK